MTYTGYARLEADDLDTWDLTIDNGFAVANLDLGFPAIRAVTDPNPDYDGEDDRTRYFGARAVTLSGVIVPVTGPAPMTRQQVLDRLANFLAPHRRPWIVYELEPGSGERRLRLRGDQHSRPITIPESAAVSASWRAPDGIQEASEITELILHGWHEGELGRVYDLHFDRAYTSFDPVGLGELTLLGSFPAYPTIVLTGPASGLRVENVTTGKRIELDMVLTAGEILTVDFARRTVVDQNGTSRFDTRDPSVSTWWTLAPGLNVLRYFPEHVDVGSTATIRARATWI